MISEIFPSPFAIVVAILAGVGALLLFGAILGARTLITRWRRADAQDDASQPTCWRID